MYRTMGALAGVIGRGEATSCIHNLRPMRKAPAWRPVCANFWILSTVLLRRLKLSFKSTCRTWQGKAWHRVIAFVYIDKRSEQVIQGCRLPDAIYPSSQVQSPPECKLRSMPTLQTALCL